MDDAQTLCTTCAGAEVVAQMVVKALSDVAPQSTPRVRLVSAVWSDLLDEQKHLIVMSVRRVVEDVSVRLQADLDDEATAAIVELTSIATFLAESCPSEIRERETIAAMVRRLLAPHVGRRIVLAGEARE